MTDITEHPTSEGKVYLCAMKDVFSNRIVGYSIADRMTSELAVAALRMAIQQRVLGRLTPVEFEAIMTTRAASAA